MIVSGKISTNAGPVAIESLKPGDMVMDRRNRPHRVAGIAQKEVTRVVAFAKNTALRVTEDAVLNTLYKGCKVGDMVGKNIVMMQATRHIIVDTPCVVETEEPVTAYGVTLEDGDNFYVSGYCLKAGE